MHCMNSQLNVSIIYTATITESWYRVLNVNIYAKILTKIMVYHWDG